MLPKTPVPIIIAQCTEHTLTAITSLFSSTHMIWTRLLEITLQLYDGLLTWPFPKTIQLSVRDQVDPQNTWTIAFAPSEKISFRRPTREPLPTLMNFNFFPHSNMFSKTENFLLNDTLNLEIKLTDQPKPEGATPSSSKP